MNTSPLTNTLRFDWNTTGGLAVRRLVWSMWNQSHSVNLWDMLSDMDEPNRQEIARLIGMRYDQRIGALREILEQSGEWDRIDDQPLPIK